MKQLRTKMSVLSDQVRLESSIVKEKLSDQELLKSLFKLVVVIALLVFIANVASYFYTNPEELEALLLQAGVFAPLMIIGLIILEVIIAPLPGFIIMVAAGYLFGPVLGGVYSYIGNVIGSLLAFLLSKHYGRPFVEKILSHSIVTKYDRFLKKHYAHLMILYMLPIIPVDILSFIAGLSKTPWKKFLMIVVVGFLPNAFLLAAFGGYLNELDGVVSALYLLVFIIVFALLSYLIKKLVDRFS